MPRDARLYLEDIVEACSRIQAYVAGMDCEHFRADGKTMDAVIRNLEVIGEAAKAVPADIAAMAPDVEWRKIAALRNVLIHEYFGINTTILWDIVANKVNPLCDSCRTLLSTLPPPKET